MVQIITWYINLNYDTDMINLGILHKRQNGMYIVLITESDPFVKGKQSCLSIDLVLYL